MRPVLLVSALAAGVSAVALAHTGQKGARLGASGLVRRATVITTLREYKLTSGGDDTDRLRVLTFRDVRATRT